MRADGRISQDASTAMHVAGDGIQKGRYAADGRQTRRGRWWSPRRRLYWELLDAGEGPGTRQTGSWWEQACLRLTS